MRVDGMRAAAGELMLRVANLARLALAAAALSIAAVPAAAQSDSDALVRRMQALQIELTNRLAGIEQSIRFVTDLAERIQRDQKESATEIRGLVDEIRYQVAEIKSQLPTGTGSGDSGAGTGPGPASGDGSIGVILRPIDDSGGPLAESDGNAQADPEAEKINDLLIAIGDLGTGSDLQDAPSADEQFEAARDLLRDGFLSDASDAFKAFIQAYPDDARIPDAYFWTGEAQFGMNRFRAAAEAHLKVVREYRGSQRAPDSLLRMATIFARQGNNAAACKTLKSLEEVYPDAGERLKGRALNESRNAGCGE